MVASYIHSPATHADQSIVVLAMFAGQYLQCTKVHYNIASHLVA